MYFFFFSSRRRHTRFDCDWSSDVCSSDLGASIYSTKPAPESSQADINPRRFGSKLASNLFVSRASNHTKPLLGHTPGSSRGIAKAASLFFIPILKFAGRLGPWALGRCLLPQDDAQASTPVLIQADPQDFHLVGEVSKQDIAGRMETQSRGHQIEQRRLLL